MLGDPVSVYPKIEQLNETIRVNVATFDEPEQLLDGVTELLDTISVEELTAVSDQSVKRVR
jgi:hypothetical protein